MFLAWAHAVEKHGKVLILCPLAVLKQIKRESERFHGTTLVDLRAGEAWTSGLAIMNYESRRDIDMRGVAGIILDESSILKNDAGETRDFLISLSANIPYRLATSATPAPAGSTSPAMGTAPGTDAPAQPQAYTSPPDLMNLYTKLMDRGGRVSRFQKKFSGFLKKD